MSLPHGLLVALLIPLAMLQDARAEDAAPSALTDQQNEQKTGASSAEPSAAAPDAAAQAPAPIAPTPAPVAQAPAAEPTLAPDATAATPPATEVVPAKSAEVAPPFTLAVELADRLGRDKSGSREDRDAATKFYDSRHAVPLWVTPTGLTAAAAALSAEIARAGDYGLDAGAFKLPGALSATPSPTELANAEADLTLAALKYARHARGGRMDPQALSSAIDRKAQTLAPAKVLEQLAASETPAETLRHFQPQNPQFEKLRQKWLAVRAGQQVLDTPIVPAATDDAPKSKSKKASVRPEKTYSPAALEQKLLVNMEMWRWMPTLGSYYIQPNIPDYTVRVVKNGQVIHTERIVTGQPTKMTPIFSDEMRLVVFKPFWNVPESIKYKEMIPQLMRGASLARSGYRADINGRPVDSSSVDWSQVDMRQLHIAQLPGGANALGRVKFLFPNKHDVYLHDTPAKDLFNASNRAFSHGCVRVRDPLKLAEIILSADKGWTRAQVDRQAESGPENTEVKLEHPVPIHITYFTASVDDADKLHLTNDVYGHEARVELGIEGKVNLIPHEQSDENYAGPSQEERRRFAERRQPKDPVGDFFKNLFN